MNTAKRTLIKFALIGSLASGVIGMPMVASAAPNEKSCHAQWMSPGFQGKGTGKDWDPALHAEAYGGTPADLSEYAFNTYCAGIYKTK